MYSKVHRRQVYQKLNTQKILSNIQRFIITRQNLHYGSVKEDPASERNIVIRLRRELAVDNAVGTKF